MNNFYTILFFLFIVDLFSQSVYTFEYDNNTYQDLTNNTVLINNDWDDPSLAIPIGFDFQLGTFTFNTIHIVDWASGGTLSSNNNESGTMPQISIIGQDIVSKGNGLSPISYKLEGANGSRIFKLEWKNYGFFDDTSYADYMNMQLWLYEGSNIIEYHYGDTSINNPTESFEGETGPMIGLLTGYNIDTDQITDETYILTGNPTNPDVSIYHAGDNNEDISAINGVIPSGTIYRFIPQNVNSITDEIEINFNIYPNPSSRFINIRSTKNTPIKKIEIFDILGKNIMTFKNINNVPINISHLINGVYFIKIKNNQGNFIVKCFVKK